MREGVERVQMGGEMEAEVVGKAAGKARGRAHRPSGGKSVREKRPAGAYNCAPVGFAGVPAASFLRIARLRSLRASLPLRSRWKRALSPLKADMVPYSSRVFTPPYVSFRTGYSFLCERPPGAARARVREDPKLHRGKPRAGGVGEGSQGVSLVERGLADGGVGRGPGGPPHRRPAAVSIGHAKIRSTGVHFDRSLISESPTQWYLLPCISSTPWIIYKDDSRRAVTLVQDALSRQAAATLIGPRQAGKTTLAQ